MDWSVRRDTGRQRAGAYFAMFRCTNMSPGLEAVTTDSGTRESAQPIQRTWSGGGGQCRVVSGAEAEHGSEDVVVICRAVPKITESVWRDVSKLLVEAVLRT